MANIHSKRQLLFLISQSVYDCGWSILYLNDQHPFMVKIFDDKESYLAKIIIYNISHGGGRRRSANEFRIQVKEPIIEQNENCKTLILGYYDLLKVFAGWDTSKHHAPGYSASLQIREENLIQASITGFSPCNKGNGEIAVAFKPDFFVEYVRHLESLHSFGQSTDDFIILEETTKNEITPNTELIQQVSVPRREVFQTVCKRQRDSRFSAKILSAYNNRCAFSGIQLKLVDAAHILPVSDDESSDETCNGIALSALHHRAYDKGLITFTEDYRIVIKKTEIDRLRGLNLHGGIDEFRKNLRPVIHVPPAIADRPNVNFVKQANRLRGW